ncbi:MAG: hypothetical protein LH473_13370 [Chitinophagales bacterium]|nr:hypothetical protein [Chitinophagales bacterium]
MRFILALLLVTTTCYAQRDGSWVLTDSIRIDYNSGAVSVATSYADGLNGENISCISDTSGVLLLYTSQGSLD